MRGAKTELSQLGESTDDLAEGFSKYADEIKALTGFDIMIDKTHFKDLYDIMEGIAGVWKNLSDTQQARVAEILGGTRQLQVISSIIGNWKDAAGAYETAINSAGASSKANAIYMERSFNAAHFIQSKDRIHRYGLAPGTATNYYYLLSESSIDQVIHKRLIEKETRLREIIESMPIPLFDNVGLESGDDDIRALITEYVNRTKKM